MSIVTPIQLTASFGERITKTYDGTTADTGTITEATSHGSTPPSNPPTDSTATTSDSSAAGLNELALMPASEFMDTDAVKEHRENVEAVEKSRQDQVKKDADDGSDDHGIKIIIEDGSINAPASMDIEQLAAASK